MVTRIITETLCTPHFHLDPDAPVVATWSGNVQLGDVRRSLDLCDEHYEKLIGDLAETLETYGQPTTAPSVAPAPRRSRAEFPEADKVPCSICGKYVKPLGIGLHRNRAHGIKA